MPTRQTKPNNGESCRAANPYASPKCDDNASTTHRLELESGWIGPLLLLGVACWLGAAVAEWDRDAWVATLTAAGAFCIVAAFRRYRADRRRKSGVLF